MRESQPLEEFNMPSQGSFEELKKKGTIKINSTSQDSKSNELDLSYEEVKQRASQKLLKKDTIERH